jgi:hypothetical protein
MGRGYDATGSQISNWGSTVARVSLSDMKISYLWEGWYLQGKPNSRFHGLSEIEFERAGEFGLSIVRGRGKFWEVDETHPERTGVQAVELRRAVESRDVLTMSTGNEKEMRSVVLRVLCDW